MFRKCSQRENTAKDGVSIENAGIGPGAEIGPEREEEVTIRPDRYALYHVGQSCPEKDRQQRAREEKQSIEKSCQISR